MNTNRALTLAALLLTAPGCDRNQLLISVDTDALVTDQVRVDPARVKDPGRATDAMVDTVRIEILDSSGTIVDLCEHYAPELSSWPVSFGVEASDQPRFLRVRLYQRALATTTTAPGLKRLCGAPVPDGLAPAIGAPLPEVTIDRLVALPTAVSGRQRLGLMLPLNCMGIGASLATRQSCVDGESAPREPLDSPRHFIATTAESRAGRSLLIEAPSDCSIAPPPGVDPKDVVCVPAGFFIMGDDRLQSFSEFLKPRPLRPVAISAFYMDRTEFTVGRMKKALALAQQTGKMLNPPFAGSAYSKDEYEATNCTWNLAMYGDDQLPVNCVRAADAQAACRIMGGDLPSEAQWEYAARGRGRRWPYPWGSQEPNRSDRCCKAATVRFPLESRPPNWVPDPDDRCTEYGPALVGTYTGVNCPEGGDVSIDGVLDLGANVSEYMRDDLTSYDQRCQLRDGVTTDPVCTLDGARSKALRGGSWLLTADVLALSADRKKPALSISARGVPEMPTLYDGFRCVYPGRK